jgi:hypothetical protein
VNECLLGSLPDARRLGYHLPRRMIPAECTSLPVLGFVRNPWSYYVSWYAFQSARGVPNALFTMMSDSGRLGFAGTVRNLVELGTSGERLDALLARLPEDYPGRGLNLPRCALEPIRGSGLGFYSYLYDYLYRDDGDTASALRLGRLESLRIDLLEMLRAVGQPISAGLARAIQSGPPLNASRHDDYRDYYAAPLADLVKRRDAPVIERFGYRFEPAVMTS